jgi:hypothetical protein
MRFLDLSPNLNESTGDTVLMGDDGGLMGETAERFFLHGFLGEFAPVNSLHCFPPEKSLERFTLFH